MLRVAGRRAVSGPARAPRRGRCATGLRRGALVFRSAHDPQAASIRFDRGSVHVTRGRSADAKLTITADLAQMNEPDAPAPKVEGIAGHLFFALGVAIAVTTPLALFLRPISSDTQMAMH